MSLLLGVSSTFVEDQSISLDHFMHQSAHVLVQEINKCLTPYLLSLGHAYQRKT